MDEEDHTLVGIVGAGRLGLRWRGPSSAPGDVVLVNSRGPDSLTSVVSMLGERATAGTVEQAAVAGIVVMAVPWSRVPDAVQGLEWNDQIVIDATNDCDGTDLDGRTSSEVVADLVPGARVVKAADTLSAEVLALDPPEANGQHVSARAKSPRGRSSSSGHRRARVRGLQSRARRRCPLRFPRDAPAVVVRVRGPRSPRSCRRRAD